MKLTLIRHVAAALLSVLSLAPFALRADANRDPVRLRIEFDRPVLSAGITEKAVVKVGLDCIQVPHPSVRPPVNLCLVIDRSGSMGGEKIAQAKNAAIEALHRLAPNDVFSLVAYDSSVETLVPARLVGDGEELEAQIRAIRAGGGTALYGGVTVGAAEIRKHIEDRRYVSRLILLSDGQANVGPSSPDELARLGSALIQEGISVTTVGVGMDFNEDLMTRLAQRSDGNTYFVASSRDLPRIFNNELGEVLSVVARSVVLTVEFPVGVRPLALIGREGSIRGQCAEFTLNQLYGGQEKFALVEVEVSSSTAGSEREIAQARLSYNDALSNRSVTVKAGGTVRFTAQEKEVIASANLKVQADYARNVTAMAKDAAVELVDASRRDEAARQLRERNSDLAKMATLYKNSEVQSLVTANAAEADRLEQSGLDNVSRKTYRAENAQTRSQQSAWSSR
jgi:Ca-activated chloride channel family protein